MPKVLHFEQVASHCHDIKFVLTTASVAGPNRIQTKSLYLMVMQLSHFDCTGHEISSFLPHPIVT